VSLHGWLPSVKASVTREAESARVLNGTSGYQVAMTRVAGFALARDLQQQP
jgi:hypothetical protein